MTDQQLGERCEARAGAERTTRLFNDGSDRRWNYSLDGAACNVWKPCSCCEYTKASALKARWWNGQPVRSDAWTFISVRAADKLQPFQNSKPGAPEPRLALMKQTLLLWEQFGDGSILLFWALTSRSEETMTVLWWGVNSSTWCCFPLSPGINTSRNPPARRKSLHIPCPPPFPQFIPPLTPPAQPSFDVQLQQPTAIHLWHIKTTKGTFTVN